MNLHDKQLLTENLKKLKNGEREAFDPVVNSVSSLLRGFAKKSLNDQNDVEDVVQQILFKVFSRVMDFDSSKDGLPWILAIAHYEILTFRKKTIRRAEKSIEQSHEIKSTTDIENEAIEKSLIQSVNELLKEMESKDREVILAKMHDYSLEGINPATYRKRLQRAFEKLRSRWDEKYGDK